MTNLGTNQFIQQLVRQQGDSPAPPALSMFKFMPAYFDGFFKYLPLAETNLPTSEVSALHIHALLLDR